MNDLIATGVIRPYRLVTYNRAGREVSEQFFSTLEDLASGAHVNSWNLNQNARDWLGSSSTALYQKAFSPRGGTLPIDELVTYGKRLSGERGFFWIKRVHTFRRGPVEGIRKWRGGSGYYRTFSNQGERQKNAGILADEGEVWPRAARQASNLPDSRDDYHRSSQRSWKSQHKGVKSWNRPLRHGNQS